METISVQFQWLFSDCDGDLTKPKYESELAAGMDVRAAVTDPLIVEPGEICLIPSGFAVAIPVGYEMQVRPRSGLAIKHGLTVVNAPGTIDADYRGEVKIGLINLGKEKCVIHRGDRIAQLILTPVSRAVFHEVTELPATKRQTGGFGHTGV